VHLVWREGSDHWASRDGQIKRSISTNGGETWQPPTHLRAGADFRDPSISYARGAAHLTWFTGTNTNPAQGAWGMREWQPPVRIDPQLPYAAICAPVVDLPDTRVGAVFYGRKPGESVDSVWMARSADHGMRWTTNRIAVAAGRHYTEPYLVRDNAQLHTFFRSGLNEAIGMISSYDSGLTWTPPRQILANATGRPTTIATANGMLVTVYRDVASRSAELAWSTDRGQTWAQGLLLLDAPPGPNGMTYAAMFEPEPFVVRGVVGMEKQDGSSSLYGFELDPS
jgi:hypothetical protein